MARGSACDHEAINKTLGRELDSYGKSVSSYKFSSFYEYSVGDVRLAVISHFSAFFLLLIAELNVGRQRVHSN